MEIEMQEKGSAEEEAGQKVDLNHAAAEELEAIAGIGPALAQRILDYRQTRGAFLSTEEITAVSGIGPVLYERISDWLMVTPPQAEVGEQAALVSEEAEIEEEAALAPEQVEVGEEGPLVLEEVELEEEVAGLFEEAEDEVEGALAPEEAVPEDIFAAPIVELEAPPPAAEEAEPTPPPPAAPEPYRGGRYSWLWSALLGGLLGVVGTLLILTIINGSVNLRQAPVILEMDNRTQALATGVDGLRDEVSELRRRLEVLEGLPARMDAVEESVGELGGAVRELNQRADALDERVDGVQGELAGVQEELAVVQTHAEKVEIFFQRLQSLLFDVFGMELP
jgi:competence ComEA-like helix-hairpin-helix protein